MTRIRVIDIETTGDDPTKDQPIELAFYDVLLVNRIPMLDESSFDQTFVAATAPMNLEALAVHHIDLHTYLSGIDPHRVQQWLHGSDVDYFCAHNAKFEQSFLPHLAPWICTYKSAYRLWPELPRHSNQYLRYHLNLAAYQEFNDNLAMPPHRAAPDAYVTAHILMAMLGYSENCTPELMAEWTRSPVLLYKCTFGKHKDKLWSAVPRDYMSWVLGQDFDEDTHYTCKYYLGRT